MEEQNAEGPYFITSITAVVACIFVFLELFHVINIGKLMAVITVIPMTCYLIEWDNGVKYVWSGFPFLGVVCWGFNTFLYLLLP